MSEIVVITGASAGIGKAAAELFIQKGCSVYNISRGASDVGGVRNISADVSDKTAVENAVGKIFGEAGKIDVLINCAGFGISGAIENADENAEKLFAVNFFGTAYAARTVVPLMRDAKNNGIIINVGSVAGKLPIPFQAYYSASKAAVLSFTSALKAEVEPFGIRVSSVLPGDVKTEFTARRQKSADHPAYGDRIKKSVEKMERDEQNGRAPALVAKKIYALSRKKNPPTYAVDGTGYSLIVFLSKILPERLIFYILKKMYG
jgi:short-subunit dehydrogenase